MAFKKVLAAKGPSSKGGTMSPLRQKVNMSYTHGIKPKAARKVR